jgi:DNA repair protein RadC
MNMNNKEFRPDDAPENSPESLFRVMRPFLEVTLAEEGEQDLFWIMGLAANNSLSTIELISRSSVDKEPIKPPDVFRVSVLKEVIKLVLVNYRNDLDEIPEGFTPSKEINQMTCKMIEAGNILDIRVMEHLIITEKDWFSYRCTGLLAKLEESFK